MSKSISKSTKNQLNSVIKKLEKKKADSKAKPSSSGSSPFPNKGKKSTIFSRANLVPQMPGGLPGYDNFMPATGSVMSLGFSAPAPATYVPYNGLAPVPATYIPYNGLAPVPATYIPYNGLAPVPATYVPYNGLTPVPATPFNYLGLAPIMVPPPVSPAVHNPPPPLPTQYGVF